MSDVTDPDLDSLCLLDRLGLTATGQLVTEDRTVLRCRVKEPNDPVDSDCWCHKCGMLGVPRATVVRRLAHVPVGWRPTILHVTVRRCSSTIRPAWTEYGSSVSTSIC